MNPSDFYSDLYIERIENWHELADLLKTENTTTAYIDYLQVAATDEHHFSPELRGAAVRVKNLFDRFFSLEASKKRQIIEILRS